MKAADRMGTLDISNGISDLLDHGVSESPETAIQSPEQISNALGLIEGVIFNEEFDLSRRKAAVQNFMQLWMPVGWNMIVEDINDTGKYVIVVVSSGVGDPLRLRRGF